MIDAETIEDIEEIDGEEVYAYGYNPGTKAWEWQWVHYDYLAEAGCTDIIARVWGHD